MLSKEIFNDLFIANKLVYEPSGFTLKKLAQEKESQEYFACTFQINNKFIKFRAAKITPTKIGQFVTIWKRIENGPIQPFDINDEVDLFVISVRSAEKLGQFVFPKKVLYEKGFVSQNGVGGKLAMRVYPPWDITVNSQAKKTQSWQLLYFFEIKPNLSDIQLIKKLFTA